MGDGGGSSSRLCLALLGLILSPCDPLVTPHGPCPPPIMSLTWGILFPRTPSSPRHVPLPLVSLVGVVLSPHGPRAPV